MNTKALHLPSFLVNTNLQQKSASKGRSHSMPTAMILVIAGAIVAIAASAVALVYYPLATILVAAIVVILAQTTIKRKNLTIINEEYAPDISVEEMNSISKNKTDHNREMSA
jgi:hypothetical protein